MGRGQPARAATQRPHPPLSDDWKNPRPGKQVMSIDFVATDHKTAAAPFVVAITLERK